MIIVYFFHSYSAGRDLAAHVNYSSPVSSAVERNKNVANTMTTRVQSPQSQISTSSLSVRGTRTDEFCLYLKVSISTSFHKPLFEDICFCRDVKQCLTRPLWVFLQYFAHQCHCYVLFCCVLRWYETSQGTRTLNHELFWSKRLWML